GVHRSFEGGSARRARCDRATATPRRKHVIPRSAVATGLRTPYAGDSRLLAGSGDVACAIIVARAVGIGDALAGNAAGRTLELSSAADDGPLVTAGHRFAVLQNARQRVLVVDLVAARERLDILSVARRVVAGGLCELGGHSVLLFHTADRALQSGA